MKGTRTNIFCLLSRPIAVNDVVIIKEENLAPKKQKLAIMHIITVRCVAVHSLMPTRNQILLYLCESPLMKLFIIILWPVSANHKFIISFNVFKFIGFNQNV